MHALRSTVLALALVLGAAACSGDTPEEADTAVDDLRAELAARAEVESALIERVEELETQLERMASDRTATQRLSDLDGQVDALSETLTSLDERFVAEEQARAAVGEEAAGAAADLRNSLADLRGRMDQLQGETDELRTLYQTLRERVDRMQQG